MAEDGAGRSPAHIGNPGGTVGKGEHRAAGRTLGVLGHPHLEAGKVERDRRPLEFRDRSQASGVVGEPILGHAGSIPPIV